MITARKQGEWKSYSYKVNNSSLAAGNMFANIAFLHSVGMLTV